MSAEFAGQNPQVQVVRSKFPLGPAPFGQKNPGLGYGRVSERSRDTASARHARR